MSRFVDAGAVFAGWIGLGMAVVLVIAFELVIPVQLLVFLLVPLMGVLIGVYANVRSERWRPRARVMANAAWAGLVTGLGIAVLYVVLRLVFVYGDTGALPTGLSLDCRTGPECTYTRYLEAGRASELERAGITDAVSFEAALLRELAFVGGALVVLTVGGSLVGGAGRALSSKGNQDSRESEELPAAA